MDFGHKSLPIAIKAITPTPDERVSLQIVAFSSLGQSAGPYLLAVEPSLQFSA